MNWNKLESFTDDELEKAAGVKQREIEIIEQGGMRYRKIDVLQQGQLKHGMKVQVGICDPDAAEL